MIPDVVIHFSRIVTKVMGKNCLALMQERVFDKMGFGEINWLTSSGRTQHRWMGNVPDCRKDLCTGTASASKR